MSVISIVAIRSHKIIIASLVADTCGGLDIELEVEGRLVEDFRVLLGTVYAFKRL